MADTLGWIYIRKNLSDNAIRIFRELTAKHRDNPVYHYHLGMALYQKGDRGGAKQSLQTALSLRPAKDDEVKIRELLTRSVRIGRFSMRHPALPWVLPFAVFMLLLAAAPNWACPRGRPDPAACDPCTRVLIFSRHLLSARFASFLPSVLVGVGVFVLWVAPDLLFAGWRSHWLFQNAIVGTLESTLPPEARSDWLALSLRIARAALLVPIVEELFWRGWLMRWIINPDFEKVPLGAYAHASFG
ncbi:MAG: CPBP family intramembrane metalloprotease [Solibacteraceae bacterium]|nr:CPBP family intramembrane metalloprotease [Solibacteraceae bacterium]